MKTRVHAPRLAAVLLGLALVTGCEQPRVQQQPTMTPAQQPGQSTGTPTSQVTQAVAGTIRDVTTKWKVKPGRHMHTTPVVVNGVIYATMGDSCICALDAETGQVKWQVSPPGLSLSSPVVANDMIYVGMYRYEVEQTSYLYAFDARTGDTKWRFQGDSARDEYASMPVVAGGIVYVGTGHADATGRTAPAGMVSALDAMTGRVVWQINTKGAEYTGVAVGEGMVFFGDGLDHTYYSDTLHAVDARTGKEQWTKSLTFDLGPVPVVVRDGLLYFGDQGHVWALDAKTGQEKWRQQVSGDSFLFPVVAEDTLYFASNEQRDRCIDNCPPHPPYTDNLYALDTRTGHEKWKFTAQDEQFSDIAVYDGVLYYDTFRPDYLKALDAQTGKAKWKFEVEDSMLGAPAVAGGVVYLGVYNGSLYALLPPGAP